MVELLLDLFGGIDFTDSRVKLLFIALLFLVFFIVGGIFFAFKLFIPKTKMQDKQAIRQAIRRLQKHMLFDKILLCVAVTLLLILGALHFTGAIDVFQLPFNMIAIVCAGIAPTLMVAVFGVRGGISSNKQKLEQLKQLEREAR